MFLAVQNIDISGLLRHAFVIAIRMILCPTTGEVRLVHCSMFVQLCQLGRYSTAEGDLEGVSTVNTGHRTQNAKHPDLPIVSSIKIMINFQYS